MQILNDVYILCRSEEPLKGSEFEDDDDNPELQQQYAKEDDEFRKFSCALKLSVSYAASAGGVGTIIGSGPNIVFKGQVEASVL